jgi:hypothetical protein
VTRGLAAVRQLLFRRQPSIDVRRRVPIAELETGELVVVVGTVRCFAEPTLTAPLSGRRCAYYRTKLYEKDEQSVLHETGSQNFFVSDDSGEALVKVAEPEVVLAMDAHLSKGIFQPFGDQAQRFLEKHGLKSQKWWFERDIRFEEGLIEPGERIAVEGRARPARGGAATFGGYREGSTRMLIEAPQDGRLRLTDIL